MRRKGPPAGDRDLIRRFNRMADAIVEIHGAERCGGKVCRTEREARNAAKELRRESRSPCGRTANAYECEECGQWHVGRARKSAKARAAR